MDDVLGALPWAHEAALRETGEELESGLVAWRTRAHLAAADSATRVSGRLSREEREDIVVALLLDQSGSMRGQKMLFAAAALDVSQEYLSSLGIACEVLGFTTSRWIGGRSRARWKRHWRPRYPGRLNDLLHIVYRDADDERVSTGGPAYRQMLRPNLPKENVDGEALEWAAGRLRANGRCRKLLVVLPDGAPVDDSTLTENAADYLEAHLLSVIAQLQHAPDIELGAVGIGFAVDRYYARSTHVEAASDLGVELVTFLKGMLIEPRNCGHEPVITTG